MISDHERIKLYYYSAASDLISFSISFVIRTSASGLLNDFSSCPNATQNARLDGFAFCQLGQKSADESVSSTVSINNRLFR